MCCHHLALHAQSLSCQILFEETWGSKYEKIYYIALVRCLWLRLQMKNNGLSNHKHSICITQSFIIRAPSNRRSNPVLQCNNRDHIRCLFVALDNPPSVARKYLGIDLLVFSVYPLSCHVLYSVLILRI